MDGLRPPLLVKQLRRQPVEQVRMRRRRSLRPEILARFDNAAAEKGFPRAVDRDTGRQRVVLVDDPVCQAQTVRHLVLRQRVERWRYAGVDLLSLVQETA